MPSAEKNRKRDTLVSSGFVCYAKKKKQLLELGFLEVKCSDKFDIEIT